MGHVRTHTHTRMSRREGRLRTPEAIPAHVRLPRCKKGLHLSKETCKRDLWNRLIICREVSSHARCHFRVFEIHTCAKRPPYICEKRPLFIRGKRPPFMRFTYVWKEISIYMWKETSIYEIHRCEKRPPFICETWPPSMRFIYVKRDLYLYVKRTCIYEIHKCEKRPPFIKRNLQLRPVKGFHHSNEPLPRKQGRRVQYVL